jgi:hypothetical protein
MDGLNGATGGRLYSTCPPGLEVQQVDNQARPIYLVLQNKLYTVISSSRRRPFYTSSCSVLTHFQPALHVQPLPAEDASLRPTMNSTLIHDT